MKTRAHAFCLKMMESFVPEPLVPKRKPNSRGLQIHMARGSFFEAAPLIQSWGPPASDVLAKENKPR